MNVEYRNYTIEIEQDTDPYNPREDDNLGTMVCSHKRYTLGDKTKIPFSDFGSWKEVREHLIKKGAKVILPIYMYDHSGITISTNPFSCPWDSGQIGFIYVTAEKIKKEFSKTITKKVIEKVTNSLIAEIETYDQYLTGEVYSFTITDEYGNHVDSCSGFFGDPEKYMIPEARRAIDYHIKEKEAQEQLV